MYPGTIGIKFKKLSEDARLPNRATPWSAGFDVSASELITIPPGGKGSVHTGLALEMPENFFALVFPRSGLSMRFPNYLSNGVGVIDSDYRGEIMVPFVNNTDMWIGISIGDRIAQMIFREQTDAQFLLSFVDELSDTLRGEGGFGSTGG